MLRGKILLVLLLFSGLAMAQIPTVTVSGYEATITYPNGKRYSTSRDEASKMFYELAEQNYTNNKLNEAVQAINMAYFCDNENAVILCMRGMLKMKFNQLDDALVDLNIAIKINHNYALAFEKRGACEGAKGDYKAAAEDLKKAVELDKKDPTTQYELGQTLVMLGQTKEAKRYLKYALKKGIASAQEWLDKCN